MPTPCSVVEWCANDNEFSTRYAHARSEGLDVLAEGCLEISDDLTEDANSRRVRVDTRKWLLSKLRPDKYGDRTSLEMTGANGGPIQTKSVRDPDLASLDEAELLVLAAIKVKLLSGTQ